MNSGNTVEIYILLTISEIFGEYRQLHPFTHITSVEYLITLLCVHLSCAKEDHLKLWKGPSSAVHS